MSDEKRWTFKLNTTPGNHGEQYEVYDYDGDRRATFAVHGDAERYVRDLNRKIDERRRRVEGHETGDAHAEVEQAKSDRLGSLTALFRFLDGEGDEVDQVTAEGLGIDAKYDDHELREEPSVEEIDRALDEYPLCVEQTRVLEIVLGTGGPDDRLLFECDCDEEGRAVSLRRVFYRYSWTGSAEVELVGEDREVAERFAARLIPEIERAV